ncbi:MAG: Gfo/Idh/MocA family oxidoreductase [Treponema sp.]|nr:Gfo/Idh/MocA family oxidoreductase [Treponema sp.]
MKTLIVGYGSMGRRRIRLLQNIVKDVEIICVDSNPERQMQAKEANIEAFSDLNVAINEKPDIAFVCTSPGHHAEIILALVNSRINVFTELNLLDNDYDKIISLAKEKDVTVFMSSTMLYNKQIQKIDEFVKSTKKPLTYIYHIGQYLPDWHPWESYKDFFIGRKETNGVREILAIQMPWIVNTFGKIKSLNSNAQRCSELDIDFNDSIVSNFVHENGNIGVFVADTVSRKATTSLEVIGEDLHLFWHGHNDDLQVYNPETKELETISMYNNVEHREGYADNIIENQYSDEIQDFIDAVYKKTTPKYSIEKDKYILKIIDEIEGKLN